MRFEPREILAATFTENAASEMRERLERLLQSAIDSIEGRPVREASDAHALALLSFGTESISRIREVLDQIDDVVLSTFHGFCMRTLSRHARDLEISPDQTAGDQELARTEFREAFLDYLREQDPTAIHPALERFES